MSKEDAKKFLGTLNDKDARLALKAKTAGAKNDSEVLEIVVDMAKEMGFDVTGEDITAALKELKAEQEEKTQKAIKGFQELGLDDLEDVTGGMYYYHMEDREDCEGTWYIRVETSRCVEDFDDTFCIAYDACSVMSVFYHDCTGKYYAAGDEFYCTLDMYQRYVVY